MRVPPRLVRRLLAPVFFALELVLLAVAVVTIVAGVLAALVDRRRRVLRLGAFAAVYLTVELVTLLGCLGLWPFRPFRSDEWWEACHFRLLGWALGWIMAAGRTTMGFAVEVDGPVDAQPLAGSEPLLVLARHGGPGDSYALVWLLLVRYRRRVRVVLKAALQWEPLLDVTLNRVGACFLPPHGAAGDDLAGRLAGLTERMEGADALLLFPEGGNWTPGRWAGAIRRLRREHRPAAARVAAEMTHVLPPRPGGVLACLDARAEIGVVVMAHTGLDRLTTAGQVWAAIPFEEAMTIRWWEAPPRPEGDEARLAWLNDQWLQVDGWIDRHGPGPVA
jgi:1-acyl-sn-glycerol-3-phosphate acyltransferase